MLSWIGENIILYNDWILLNNKNTYIMLEKQFHFSFSSNLFLFSYHIEGFIHRRCESQFYKKEKNILKFEFYI